MMNNNLYSSGNIEWETPQWLFDKLDQEFLFTLDACASSKNTKCIRFFNTKDDSLKLTWYGRVWMNPPYGKEISKFVEKAYTETINGNTEFVICLLPVRSDTKWWHKFCMKAKEIRLLTKRLEFIGSNNKAPFPSCLVVFQNTDSNFPNLVSYEV